MVYKRERGKGGIARVRQKDVFRGIVNAGEAKFGRQEKLVPKD